MRIVLRRLFRISNPPAGPMSPAARRNAWGRRVKIMMRHTWLITVAATLLCAGVGGVAYYFMTLPTYLNFSVGPPNSEDTRVVQAIAAHLARDHANIRLHTKVLDGGTRHRHAEAGLGRRHPAQECRDLHRAGQDRRER
jgi:hypothetical protein